MKLIPAPLSTSRDECRAQFSMLLPHFSHFQIDIQDGIYVTSRTISLTDYLEVMSDVIRLSCPEVQTERSSNIAQGNGFFSRQWRDWNDGQIDLDLHLMLADYEKTLQWLRVWMDPSSSQQNDQHRNVQIRTVFVHTNISSTLFKEYVDLPLSLAFSPPDDPRDWTEYLQISNHAQVMTIYPGPQGQQFMPEMLAKVGQIHEINPRIQVCIDGAVNEVTYPIINSLPKLCIPDELAVGSYFSKATTQNIQSRIEILSV